MTLRDQVLHEPTWDIVQLFPPQGMWSESEYLSLDTNRLVEFSHGTIEILPMPSRFHQEIVLALCFLLRTFMRHSGRGGSAIVAPFSVQLWDGKYREPDIVYMLPEHAAREKETYWEGADLVMEVISPDDPSRDTVVKRREYAQAGIPEYWLVDPASAEIAVLTLTHDRYEPHGLYGQGDTAVSALLPGFSVDVTALFDQPR